MLASQIKYSLLLLLLALTLLNISLYFIIGIDNFNNKPFSLMKNRWYLNSSIRRSPFPRAQSNFSAIHNNILITKKNVKLVFLRVRKIGYGNQIYAMLSAFLVAVLTDSALLIHWPSIHIFIDTPLLMTFKSFKDSSVFDFDQKQPKICQIDQGTANTWAYSKKLIYLQVELPHENCSRYLVDGMNPYFFDLASNPKYYDKLVESRFVRRETVTKASADLKNMAKNSSERLESIFAIGFEFAGHVLNNYWLANEYIQENVDLFYENEFRDFFVIGLQMRFTYLSNSEVEVFLKCALQIENEYKRNNIRSKEVNKSLNC